MNTPETETIIITEDEAGQRLDKILANRFKEVRSRTYFQSLIRDHNVLLNGSPIKKQVKPQVGDEVEILFVLTPEIDVTPEPIPLDVLYEDEDILVVNKPSGMVVHPAPGNWSGTFVNALLYHCKQLPSDSQHLRPGIVHRLDKETSGVLVSAKTSQAQQRLVEMFASREVYKEYLAICLGDPGEGEINLPIGRHPKQRQRMTVLDSGGRNARTIFRTLASDGTLSLVDIILATGRTHQIRVHMQHHGTPVLGDSTYGNIQANKKFKVTRQLLHARKIRFTHPITKREMEFVAEIPSDMATFIQRLEFMS
ncbi:MAG: Ribosomal large subunit pseudouridine synthase D [Chlamydiae bacterium]|nr:Ribosomal large subunit pseudouridine synthase D [Chlamydiota bacterium]